MRRLLASTTILLLTLCPIAAQSVSRLALPWVLYGYRSLTRQWLPDTVPQATPEMWREAIVKSMTDTVSRENKPAVLPSLEDQVAGVADFDLAIPSYSPPYDSKNPIGPATPGWLADAIRSRNVIDDFMYRTMIEDPHYIRYAEWDLPIPPTIPEEDKSFLGYLRRQNLNSILPGTAEIDAPGIEGHINWLHLVNASLQLSQAYISDNWYQGGSDYLAFFGNFLWDVNLNEVFHPKLMFQSTLNYKLAINSTLQDKYHKYAISQELFQHNLKFGYRARHNWFYTITTLFKTQFLNSYGTDSQVRKAGFLSPATFNVGVGMTYSLEKKKGKLKFSASVAPISYNLTACIDDKVDHGQFNMKPGQRTLSEVGSNAEFQFYWAFRNNISYKSRMFLFSDYKKFTGDWENTFNFQWTKLFSTQIYLYFRYDSSTSAKIDPKWKKWMLKEILSVGLSYSFSTKVK